MSELSSLIADQWQPVIGWEGLYEVSRSGLVRHVDGGLLGQWPNQDGYMLVRLAKPRRMVRVHRLVADAFIPNPDNLPHVNHIDNDRANNSDRNLEWCTQKQNLEHARRQGRMPDNFWKGKRSPNALLGDNQVREVRQMYSAGGYSQSRLGQMFGVSKRAIGRLLSGETYPLPSPPRALQQKGSSNG